MDIMTAPNNSQGVPDRAISSSFQAAFFVLPGPPFVVSCACGLLAVDRIWSHKTFIKTAEFVDMFLAVHGKRDRGAT